LEVVSRAISKTKAAPRVTKLIISNAMKSRNPPMKTNRAMAEIRHFPQGGYQTTRENVARKTVPAENPAVKAQAYCVYNQTRERFVVTCVETADASAGNPETGLRSLEPRPGTGIWIFPCQEISPASIRFPLDLVYLNDDCVVLEVVASFPLAGPAASSAKAGSILALPANTVDQGEIHAGDQLIISAPEEMKRHLQMIKEAKAEGQGTPSSFLELFAKLPSEKQAGPVAEAPPEDLAGLSQPEASYAAFEKAEITGAEMPVTEEPSPPSQIETQPCLPQVETQPRRPQVETQPWKKPAQSKNWFARLFEPDPVDPRIALRESLPGLIAYFFTGGTPMGHAVRDISVTGMYVVTHERWYPGTVVRITLTDRHSPTVQRSITVNARAVRSGSDGVGVEFVLDVQNRRNSSTPEGMELTNCVDPAQIEEFLRIYKSPPQ
jgi:hypothetical protein